MTRMEKIKIANNLFKDAKDHTKETMLGGFNLLYEIFNNNVFYINKVTSINRIVNLIKSNVSNDSIEIILKRFSLDEEGCKSYKQLADITGDTIYIVRRNYRKGISDLKFIKYQILKEDS